MSCGSASVRVLAQRSLPSRRPSPPRLADVSLRTVELDCGSSYLFIYVFYSFLPTPFARLSKIVRVERAGTSLALLSQPVLHIYSRSLTPLPLPPPPTTTLLTSSSCHVTSLLGLKIASIGTNGGRQTWQGIDERRRWGFFLPLSRSLSLYRSTPRFLLSRASRMVSTN